MNISIQKQVRIALRYFLIAAGLGVLLRLLHVFDIEFTYKFIKHGHSHIALLGWIYVCLTTILYKLFVKQEKQIARRFNLGFVATQITLIGMLITFPIQGYALFSIVFSTLFLFVSYWFTWFFFKNIKDKIKTSASFPYIKASLYYLVLSSIGPWALGGIMATLGNTSVWYRLAIYFYLHFQYNGWMLLALLGIIIFLMERGGITLSRNRASEIYNQRESEAVKRNKNLFLLINASIVLTVLLSALWTAPENYVYGLSAFGAAMQVLCLGYALFWIWKNEKAVKRVFTALQYLLFKIVLIVLSIKLLLQFVGSFPYFANLSSNIIELTIAYLHWMFLGIISVSLFLILDMLKLITLRRKQVYYYLIGFILTEGLLIYKGIAIWSQSFTITDYFNEYLLVTSGLLFTAIAWLVFKPKINLTQNM